MFLRRRICAHFRDVVSTDTATRSDRLPRTWLRGCDRRGRSLVISIGADQRITERATEAKGNNKGGRLVGREEDWERVTRAITHTWGVQKSAREETRAALECGPWGGNLAEEIASRWFCSPRHLAKRNPAMWSYAKILSRFIYCTPRDIFLNDFISH